MFLQKQFLKKISSSYNFSTISVMSPYSLQPEFEVKVKKLKEANLQLENSQIAYNEWKKQPIDQRIKVCLRACDYFQENQQHIATQISTQMGKPIKQVIQFFDKIHFAQLFSKALEEVTKSIHRINVLCEMAPQALQDEIISNQNSGYMKIAKESLGVVLIISGWNNPLLSSINCLVSSILCGNTVIIKPSPFTPLSAKNFQDAFEYCGIQNISCQRPYNNSILLKIRFFYYWSTFSTL